MSKNSCEEIVFRFRVDYDEDDDDEESHIRSKWSKPIMQKQRMMYMDNLNAKKRSNVEQHTDEFNERRWNKASNEMKSHVVTSKARKTAALKSSGAQTNQSPSIFSRLSSAMFGATTSEPTESGAGAAEKPKRSYGFATRNLALYSDKNSEELYRYKNLSSSYMRSSSPTRDNDDEEDKPAAASTTDKKDSDNEGSDKDSGDSSKRRPRRGSKK
jgi:hypothetical protein